MNRFTVDDIKRETVRAFRPLRCEVHDFDYDSGFDFSIFDAEDPVVVYAGELRTSQYQNVTALAQVFRRWRVAVAAKGYELTPWTADAGPLQELADVAVVASRIDPKTIVVGTPMRPDKKWSQLCASSEVATKALAVALAPVFRGLAEIEEAPKAKGELSPKEEASLQSAVDARNDVELQIEMFIEEQLAGR